MAHTKVFGFCENLCNVEVPAKESIYNENLLINCDSLLTNGVVIGSHSNYANVNVTNMQRFQYGIAPSSNQTSGQLKMKYRYSAIDNDVLAPVVLQMRFYNNETNAYSDEIFVFETGAESFTKTYSLNNNGLPITLTYTISLDKTNAVVDWSSTDAIRGLTVDICGAKLERGTSPSTFTYMNGTDTGHLMLCLGRDVAMDVVHYGRQTDLNTTDKTVVGAINELLARIAALENR